MGKSEDDDLIEFNVTANSDDTIYSIIVCCKSGLSKEEFIDALREFADGVDRGDYSFEQESFTEASVQ
jgi:hypothetical protein